MRLDQLSPPRRVHTHRQREFGVGHTGGQWAVAQWRFGQGSPRRHWPGTRPIRLRKFCVAWCGVMRDTGGVGAILRPIASRRSLEVTNGPRPTDADLVDGVRAGDDGAFEAIYERYARGVLAFCAH